MTELAIIVPVLARPQNVRPLLTSIYAATPDAHVVFVADPDDAAEIEEIELHQGCLEAVYGGLRISLIIMAGNYAEKIACGVENTIEPLIFAGADDLAPIAGWFESAKAAMVNGIEVVGVNDLLPRKRHHATHFLISREYAEAGTIDGGTGPFHTGYAHNFCDDELIATAKHKGAYAYAESAHVEHLHPQGRTAPDDKTYSKGRTSFKADRRQFESRRHLWT